MGNSVLDQLRAGGPKMRNISPARGRLQLPIVPASAGYDLVMDRAYDWHGMRRGDTPFVILQHTLSGCGRLTFDRRNYRVDPGATMLVTVPHNHRYWAQDSDDWEFFWIVMYGEEAVKIHRSIIEVVGPLVRLSDEGIGKIAQCCLTLIEGEGETAGRASALAYSATMVLYDEVLGARPGPPVGRHESGLGAVAEYVQEHVDRDLRVPLLAEIAGLSRSHFTRAFTTKFGVSPGEYVVEQRMRCAIRLLESSALSIKAVAIAAGFRDANYFAKAFRRAFGVSPTEFRTTGMYATSAR